MRKIFILAAMTFVSVLAYAQTDRDWAGLGRFTEVNAQLKSAPAAVLLGDSITELWMKNDPEFFESHNLAGRGISGQTSSQMLVRFRRDVIDLHPRAVVIMAGTNDIALNNGVISLDDILGNIISMVELAQANDIVPILCSVPPCAVFSWRKELRPAEDIVRLNALLKAYAYGKGISYVDYHSALKDEKNAMRAALSSDGCHPVKETYQTIMEPVLLKVLGQNGLLNSNSCE